MFIVASAGLFVLLEVLQHVVEQVELDAEVTKHNFFQVLAIGVIEQTQVDKNPCIQVKLRLLVVLIPRDEGVYHAVDMLLDLHHEGERILVVQDQQGPPAFPQAVVECLEQFCLLGVVLVGLVGRGVHPQDAQLHLLVVAHFLHEGDAVHVVPRDEVDGHQRGAVLDHVVERDHVQVEHHHLADGLADQLNYQFEELPVLAERRDQHFG